jgi:Kazal-type serine protease inhibitor domain
MKAWRWFALASITACACGSEAGSNDGVNPTSPAPPANVVEHDCEGPEALVCTAGKFCAAAEANRCPGLETAGRCIDIPQACIDIYQPICGCDGQTYGNDCHAAAAGVAIAYDGACGPLCGGFAGLPCPGSGTCVDNPTDGCDPLQGDSDCAALCRCEVTETCDGDARWNGSPEVCACVWE